MRRRGRGTSDNEGTLQSEGVSWYIKEGLEAGCDGRRERSEPPILHLVSLTSLSSLVRARLTPVVVHLQEWLAGSRRALPNELCDTRALVGPQIRHDAVAKQQMCLHLS